jgi:hypothetical protein
MAGRRKPPFIEYLLGRMIILPTPRKPAGARGPPPPIKGALLYRFCLAQLAGAVFVRQLLGPHLSTYP